MISVAVVQVIILSGFFRNSRKNFFGARYSFRSYTSHLASDQSQFSKDFYQTAEFWGGMNLGKKWQVMVFVPYNINKQTSDDGIKNSSGLGDATFITNYKLLDKRTGDKRGDRLSQQLWVGGGVKMPTGKFAADPNDIIPDANNQPGTGSVDFLVNAMYTFHINDWGINSNMNYKINRNAENFHFGNRYNASAYVFHSITSGDVTFNPNIGALYEKLEANKLGDAKVADTGGNALLGAAGLEVNFPVMAVGFNTQLPISQNLSNRQTTARVRGMLHVTFTF